VGRRIRIKRSRGRERGGSDGIVEIRRRIVEIRRRIVERIHNVTKRVELRGIIDVCEVGAIKERGRRADGGKDGGICGVHWCVRGRGIPRGVSLRGDGAVSSGILLPGWVGIGRGGGRGD
jgi:hypothetical protein